MTRGRYDSGGNWPVLPPIPRPYGGRRSNEPRDPRISYVTAAGWGGLGGGTVGFTKDLLDHSLVGYGKDIGFTTLPSFLWPAGLMLAGAAVGVGVAWVINSSRKQ